MIRLGFLGGKVIYCSKDYELGIYFEDEDPLSEPELPVAIQLTCQLQRVTNRLLFLPFHNKSPRYASVHYVNAQRHSSARPLIAFKSLNSLLKRLKNVCECC